MFDGVELDFNPEGWPDEIKTQSAQEKRAIIAIARNLLIREMLLGVEG